MENDNTLKLAINGDINAFQKLFADFQPQLKSYLYRIVTDRNDADDLTHDTFVKAFDKISTFKGDASLKTWVFTIATRLAYDHQKRLKRWLPDAQDKSKALALSDSTVYDAINHVSHSIGKGAYNMKEHIDFCFTCISKTLPIEQQVALILKDIYDFSVKEICMILDLSLGVVKHLLINARKTMTNIFEHRCALINKNGVCHQCSELNGLHNPKQNQQEALMKLELVKAAKKSNRAELYKLRTKLVKGIDPLHTQGADLQDVIMKCTRKAIGEIQTLN
ncbi:RNA polymerase sigma factor [Marivirga sp.]|uniref:RNA polymerase sigma factor n=1 Tax=Marivirga sp. TaxID=2018662 RepID=UPI002D7EFF2B|nr:RNA polymerase sigma factor [Marivirga sp.]HET8860967.1 RNA polymerase sigma factor [Marivirga sp.]